MSLYRFSLQCNDSYAFRAYPKLTANQRLHQDLVPDMSGTARPGVRRCDACGDLLDKWNEPLSGLVLKKRKYDISKTYDDIAVVSERFRAVFEEGGLAGLSFATRRGGRPIWKIVPGFSKSCATTDCSGAPKLARARRTRFAFSGDGRTQKSMS